MYPRLANEYANRKPVMERYAATRAVYLADGDAPEPGEILRQPDLARTLERIAARGFDGFYRGPVAQALLASVKADGVDWTAAELAAYRVRNANRSASATATGTW